MAGSRVLVGRNTAVAVDQYDVSGTHNEFKFKRDAAVVDATGFGARFNYDLAGIQKASLELKGFFDPGYDHLDQIINQRFGQDDDVLTLLAPGGYAALEPAIMMPSVVTKYDITAKLKGAVDIDCQYMARGAVDEGFILISPLNFLVGASGASNTIDHTDFGGETDSGCTAQLHLLQADGTTPSLVFKIQDSADGIAWTDLMTFEAATDKVAQRLVLPQGSVVKEFVRATWTNSGTGNTVKALLGFARGVHYS